MASIPSSINFEAYSITSYDLAYSLNVSNLGPSDALAIPLRVALLQSWTPHQKVLSRTVLPEPNETYTDALGNAFALYQIDQLKPERSFNVTIRATLEVYSIDYNVDPRNVGEYHPSDSSFANHVIPSKLIESESAEIKGQARAILAESSFLLDVAFKSYNWVIDNLSFERLAGELGALYTYKNRVGDSAEISNLLVALLRANRIPAQRISGWGGTFVMNETYTAAQVAHGWSELYLANYGWIPMDPTFGRSQRFDNFLKSDERHIILTKGAGVHLFTRGLYETPFGAADVLTSYNIHILDKATRYVSPAGNVITALFFAVPITVLGLMLVRIRKKPNPDRPRETPPSQSAP